MRTMMRDAHGALLRAVGAILSRDDRVAHLVGRGHDLPGLTIAGVASERWASATFAGQRHRVDIRLRGAADEVEAARAADVGVGARAAIAESLPAAEFDVRGHLVADVALVAANTAVGEGITVCDLGFEMLTVED